MSNPEPVPKSNGHDAPSMPKLDTSKLHSLSSEQQDLYLLTFAADLARYTDALDGDGVSAEQVPIKRELVQIISLPTPAPTRVIRNNLGRCFATLFGKGNRKLLYESINDLLGIINNGKAEKEQTAKHAAVHCLGDIFEVAGDSVTTLAAEICSTLIRLLKSTANHAGVRSSVFQALRKVFHMLAASADESIARDTWKQARNAASVDKAALVRRSALRCLEELVRSTSYFDNSNDYESLKSTVFKSMETAAPNVRHAAASCFAAALGKSFSEDTPNASNVRAKKSKKPARKQSMSPEDDQEIPRSDSPAPRKAATKVAFGLVDLLRQLSTQYVRTATSNRLRAGLALCYTRTLKSLGGRVVHSQYMTIADHLFIDLLSHPTVIHNRYRLLTARKYTRIILEDVVGRQMLAEAGQLDAAKSLVNDILKNYPQFIKERAEPTKYCLTGALGALASLIKSLGSAISAIADMCRDGLLQVLQHLSYTVQVSTAHCLREFVLACPQQLLPCLSICMNSVTRELNLLTSPRQSPRKCVGYANGLAAVLSISTLQPLYGSIDVNSRILDLATGILKSSTNSEIRISGTQIQVAWIVIGGLMSLGPNFVKIHVSTLLLLWKNALPKPIARENMSLANLVDLSFLTHVRECALGSILAFLESNSRLLTTDVSKRIAVMLQNTTAFLDTLPPKKTTEDVSQRLSPSLQLADLDLMVRRRVLQCYTKLVELSPAGGGETLLHSNLVTLAMSFFADPDNYSPSSLSTSIANTSANFESLWEIGDNCGFGVTGLVCGLNIKGLPGEAGGSIQPHWLMRKGTDAAIDQTLLSPVSGAREHDSVSLYAGKAASNRDLPDPSATEVVNSAIRLFAISLPLQPPKIQESILEQISTFLSTTSLQRDPGRKAAMTVNVAVALLATLQVAAKETSSDPGDLKDAAVEKIMQELLEGFILHPDQFVRNIAGEALGRLCSSSGNSFTTDEVNNLMEIIVYNRDPNARAGCAVALGCIHSQVGGLAASFHLKNMFGILMSLIRDPHPTVHFWALEGLIRLADSAGLTFSGMVSGCLGMLSQVYVADTHNDEVVSVASSNLEEEWSTVAAIARCMDSLVNVLGPDLQDISKARDLILALVGQLGTEKDSLVLLESLRCQEHLSIYVSGYVQFDAYVRRLQSELGSPHIESRDAAVDGLYNLMKRNPEEVLKTAGPGLEDQFWLVLDDEPNHEGIQNIIRNWLHQTCLSSTALWIRRCQAVLNMTKPKDETVQPVVTKSSGMPDLQDEEVAGFAAAEGSGKDENAAAPGSGQEPLKWQVRTFAMSCLSDVLAAVGRDVMASDGISAAEIALQQSVADVIRMAFSASTSNVVELRVWGLRLIDQVLKIFGKTPDPDFSEAPLLEQYQAQISSALTPAFTAESSPELASEAVNVCAAFIATGIVTDVDRMGRILKLLVSALENFSEHSETAAIGDLKGLSSNAQVMVKMAVFSGWAELQVASVEQKYLVDVVKPHIARLTPLWLSSLNEFARLRFEPDISMSSGPPMTGDLDMVYSALHRETLLKFYQDTWLNLVDAIASLIEQDSAFVFEALDGKTEPPTPNGTSRHTDINYRDEPVAFFFVLFGIAFEALMGRSGNDALASKGQTVEILLALKKILHPSVSGHAIYQDVVFSETMDLLDRLVLTEGLDVQTVIVDIVRNLCVSHPSARQGHDPAAGGDNLSEDIDELFELTRIIALVLAGLLPNLVESKTQSRSSLSDEAISLVRLSLEALVDAAGVFPSVIKTDLHACIFHLFATILGTASCQAAVVPQALPIFKRFLREITQPSDGLQDDGTITLQLRGCLQRFLAILKNAQRRESEASLPCEKNTLFAATVLVTGGAKLYSATDPLISSLLDEFMDCLDDRMTAKVAANCIRSIMLSTTNTTTEESISQILFPKLLVFLTNTSSPDPEGARSLVAAILTSFATTLSTEQISAAICLLIPTLLSRATSEGERVYRETAARLLELAGADPGAFKGAVSTMESTSRAFMERVLREGGRRDGGSQEDSSTGQDKEPSIALKMNFGGST